MSRKAIKTINWAALAEKIPQTEKVGFAAFKAKSDKHLQRMNTYSETAPKIDWVFYKKNVPVVGLVDKFQKEYESFKVPYPPDNYTSEVETEEKKVLAEMEKFVLGSNDRITNAKKEIERIKNMLPFSEMTMEDFHYYYPELAFNPEKPTIWPHTPEYQPENEPKRPSH